MPTHPQLVLVGQQLRKLREARGYSQENFALECGLARSYYSGIERGHRNLAALNLIRIADTLGVEVGELFPDVKKLKSARPAPARKYPLRSSPASRSGPRKAGRPARSSRLSREG
jgi:transcriptional regulator with XRE-family HTH domain